MSQYLMYQIRGRVFRHILTVAICDKKKSDKNIFFKLLLIVLICLSVLCSF